MNIPYGEASVSVIDTIIDQSLLLSMDNEVGIVLRAKCGSFFVEAPDVPFRIPVLGLYKLPVMLGSKLVLRCFHPECKYMLMLDESNWNLG